MTVKEVVVKLSQNYRQRVPDTEKVAGLKDDYYLKLHQFKLYPGVTTMIDTLAEKKIPLGIVTG
ncbi:uncharacterized protein METZ01_LOCUS479519, partial [marine metagenome]